MIDFFLLLDQPRQPWVVEERLHAAFLERSRQCHPDRFHEADPLEKREAHDRYVELNSAYHQLKEHRSRLLHLIQLETGNTPADVQEIPHDTTDLFMQVGQACREADQFLKAHANAASSILKAQRLIQARPVLARCQTILQSLEAWQGKLVEVLQQHNESWLASDSNHGKLLSDLEQLSRLLSYQDRWTRQIKERMFLLTSP